MTEVTIEVEAKPEEMDIVEVTNDATDAATEVVDTAVELAKEISGTIQEEANKNTVEDWLQVSNRLELVEQKIDGVFDLLSSIDVHLSTMAEPADAPTVIVEESPDAVVNIAEGSEGFESIPEETIVSSEPQDRAKSKRRRI